jgi:hypothetical protein
LRTNWFKEVEKRASLLANWGRHAQTKESSGSLDMAKKVTRRTTGAFLQLLKREKKVSNIGKADLVILAFLWPQLTLQKCLLVPATGLPQVFRRIGTKKRYFSSYRSKDGPIL